MSFEDHVSDMTQKYRLAIAISVLKSKPSDLSIEQYIEKLKNKYQNTEIELEDFDISIRSEDFNFDVAEIEAINDAFSHNFDENDPSVANTGENTESQTILVDYGTKITMNRQNEENSYSQVMQTLRDIDETANKQSFDPSQNNFYYEDTQLFDYRTTNIYTGNTTKGTLSHFEQVKDCLKVDLTSKDKDKAALTKENTPQKADLIFKDSGKNALTREGTISSKKVINKITFNVIETMSDTDQIDQAVRNSTTFTQNFTHISQSQYDDLNIPHRHLFGNQKVTDERQKVTENCQKVTEKGENIDNNINIGKNNNRYHCSEDLNKNIKNNDKCNREIHEINGQTDEDIVNLDDSMELTLTADELEPNFVSDKNYRNIDKINDQITQNTEENLDVSMELTEDIFEPNFLSDDTMLIGIPSNNQNHLAEINEIHGLQSTQDIGNNFESQDLIDDGEFIEPSKREDSMFMGPEEPSMFKGPEEPSMYLGPDSETSTKHQNRETSPNRKQKTQVVKINSNITLNKIDSSQISYIIDNNGMMYRIVHEQEQNIQESNKISENIQERRNISQNMQDRNIISLKSQNMQEDRNIISLKSRNIQDDRKVISQNTQENRYMFQNTQPDKNISQNTQETQGTQISQNTQETQGTQISQNTQETQYEDNIEQELTNSQIEVVSFKVLEEFKRIKTLLSKNDRKITDASQSDSGYKSDSQKSVVNASQSTNWVNQSAHCLFNYLLNCLLIHSTEKITGEISQVLARLIDRLHDDEHYPSFLAAILESIDKMIADLTDGQNYGEHVLVKKDETIQRLCLLNKSLHIIKYSIEKITQKLEIIHTNLTTEKMYEMTNIDDCENACYIFHVLEILLERYIKVKDVITQESIYSQDEKEKILKKSSITDIWRKKWIPNYKDNVLSNVCMEKQCILTKCSEVLNKIIVGCMEGYSLVSFSALQCFNLMQK